LGLLLLYLFIASLASSQLCSNGGRRSLLRANKKHKALELWLNCCIGLTLQHCLPAVGPASCSSRRYHSPYYSDSLATLFVSWSTATPFVCLLSAVAVELSLTSWLVQTKLVA